MEDKPEENSEKKEGMYKYMNYNEVPPYQTKKIVLDFRLEGRGGGEGNLLKNLFIYNDLFASYTMCNDPDSHIRTVLQ